jgi:hypothetical protein
MLGVAVMGAAFQLIQQRAAGAGDGVQGAVAAGMRVVMVPSFVLQEEDDSEWSSDVCNTGQHIPASSSPIVFRNFIGQMLKPFLLGKQLQQGHVWHDSHVWHGCADEQSLCAGIGLMGVQSVHCCGFLTQLPIHCLPHQSP